MRKHGGGSPQKNNEQNKTRRIIAARLLLYCLIVCCAGIVLFQAADAVLARSPIQTRAAHQEQPVTRAEVEQIRGVKCDYSLQSLITKGLIRETGRKDTIGRPILFGTTDEFLSHFGLEGLDSLPPMPQEPDSNKDTISDDDTELIP